VILRYLVALPCFNNSDTVEKVIVDALALTAFPLLVIDDGSDQPVRDLVTHPEALKAIASGRLSFIRHEKNIGKGGAIQTAFKWALGKGFTHVLTCDTDGQHLASEIPKVVERSRVCPWSLIIGSRKWQGDVPGSSKFGRKFSNFWVSFETGYEALDSQSGFRVYPMFYVQNFSFFTKKYDFEIEVLIRLLWSKVDVQEVDIEVYYPPGQERVTHFNKFSDNVRISLLNCILVVVSLLRGHLDPLNSGVALGLGVLIGMTPFFGVHTLIVAGVALTLRLNFLLLLIGSQVSLPIFVPFVAVASIRAGRWILGRPVTAALSKWPHGVAQAFAMSRLYFVEWLVGSLFLGLILGALVGGLYYFAKRWYSRQRSETWTGKTRGGSVGNGFLRLVLRFVGIRAGYFCLLFIVPYFYFFSPRARRSISQYWRAMSPGLNWWERQRHILKHFYVFGQVLMDRVFQSYQSELYFEMHREGPSHFDVVSQSDRGWIFVGAHVGGWDISTHFFQKDIGGSRLGRVHFIGQGYTFDNAKREEKSSRVDSIESGNGDGSLIVVKNFLAEKKHVGFLADRAIGSQIELIPFLGKLAPFETRPFRVAAVCRAPICITYGFKMAGRQYEFYSAPLTELVYDRDLDRREQIYKWTEFFVRDLETQIRRHPYQWFNFYPFWSSLPKQVHGVSTGRQDHCLQEELYKPASPAAAPVSLKTPIA